jgi:hypothetical protein
MPVLYSFPIILYQTEIRQTIYVPGFGLRIEVCQGSQRCASLLKATLLVPRYKHPEHSNLRSSGVRKWRICPLLLSALSSPPPQAMAPPPLPWRAVQAPPPPNAQAITVVAPHAPAAAAIDDPTTYAHDVNASRRLWIVPCHRRIAHSTVGGGRGAVWDSAARIATCSCVGDLDTRVSDWEIGNIFEVDSMCVGLTEHLQMLTLWAKIWMLGMLT